MMFARQTLRPIDFDDVTPVDAPRSEDLFGKTVVDHPRLYAIVSSVERCGDEEERTRVYVRTRSTDDEKTRVTVVAPLPDDEKTRIVSQSLATVVVSPEPARSVKTARTPLLRSPMRRAIALAAIALVALLAVAGARRHRVPRAARAASAATSAAVTAAAPAAASTRAVAPAAAVPPREAAEADPGEPSERAAIEAVASGSYARAARIYRALALAHPSDETYRQAARILLARSKEGSR
jgi:hypothetical protein